MSEVPTVNDAPEVTCQIENEKDKPSTPTKEEMETNEKNVIAATKLGQIIFKLRSVVVLYAKLRALMLGLAQVVAVNILRLYHRENLSMYMRAQGHN